jgi:hypothetical protein
MSKRVASPVLAPLPLPRLWRVVFLALCGLLTVFSPGFAFPVNSNLWGTNGPVYAVAQFDGTMYVGGGSFAAGKRDLIWDLRDDGGRKASQGVFFVRGRIGAFEGTRKVVVIG